MPSLFLKLNNYVYTPQTVEEVAHSIITGDAPEGQGRAKWKAKWAGFVVAAGRLRYRKDNVDLEVVPTDQVQNVLTREYQNPAMGVGDGQRMFYEKLCAKYIGIKRAVAAAFLKKQPTYQETRPLNHVLNKPIYASNPNERWAIDLMDMTPYFNAEDQEGRLVNGGFRYILNCIDFNTRACWSRPLKLKTSIDVAITSKNYYSARSVSIIKSWTCVWSCTYDFCYTSVSTVGGKSVYSGYQGTQSLYKSSTAKFTAENNVESDNDDTITVASSNSSFTVDTSTEFVWSEYSNSKSASYSNSAVSSDGTVIVGAIGEGGLEISVDSGDTWTTSTAAGKHVDWSDVITSSDGSYIFAVTHGGSVYASSDYGVTLTEASVPVEDDFISVKCSR